MKRCKDGSPLRGVELFNLLLIRDLVDAGIPVVVIAERSWKTQFEAVIGARMPDVVWLPNLALPFLHGIMGALRVALRRFDTLLVGNAGDGIVPAIHLLKQCGGYGQAVVIAHREPSKKFARLFRSQRGHVLCVNGRIADDFAREGCAKAVVDYGILNADSFSPPTMRREDGLIHFAVVGALDNPWKGAETAVRAFRQLPPEIHQRARLHLASFESPPSYDDPHITAYSWMPLADISGFLREMDVLIVPSHDEEVMRETFSQATVQGMLTGLPIIHSALPILVEKFDRGGGIQFTTEPDLTNAMIELAQHPEKRQTLGREARDTALTRYVWDTNRFIDRYLVPPVGHTDTSSAAIAPSSVQPDALRYDTEVAIGPYTGRISPACDTQALREWLVELGSTHLATGRILASGRHQVVRIESDDAVLAVKSFGRQSWLKDRIDAVRGSKARRSYQNARHLQAHGIGTPTPVACLERWSGTRLVEQYFITQYEENLSAFREELIHLYRHEPHCDKLMALLECVAEAVSALHRSGLMHGDLGNQNILLRRYGSHTWGDVMFIDLNRARTGTIGCWRRCAYDLARLSLPSDFLRVFKAMYLGAHGPEPAALRGAESFYRRWYAWHTRTRALRHPIRTRRRRRMPKDPAMTYPDIKDIWIWDERSGQAISTMTRKDRKKQYPRGNAVKIAASVITAVMPVRRLYKQATPTSFTEPVDFAGRVGMTLQPRPDTWHNEWEWMKQLGPLPLLFRLYHHEKEEDWAFIIRCMQQCHAAGFSVSVAMVQNRRAVRDPASWDAFVRGTLEPLADIADWVEIGHAINRVKWGIWTLDEYARLCEPFVPFAGGQRGVKLMGPAVIDFEYQYLVAACRRLRGVIKLDALSHHLYVDRRGAPENAQSGFATAEKAALARAIAEWSGMHEPKLIVSEVNWPLLHTGVYSPVGSPYVAPGPRSNDPSVTESVYADFMIRYHIQALASGHVERVYWWRLAAHGYGLIDDRAPDGWRARPAYYAYRTFLQHVGSSTFMRRLPSPAHVYAYAFRREDRNTYCAVAYAHPTPSEWMPPFAYREALTLTGEPCSFPSRGMVTLSGSPVYFEGIDSL